VSFRPAQPGREGNDTMGTHTQLDMNDMFEGGFVQGNGCESPSFSSKEPTGQPRVWDCHAGKDYPADAIAVCLGGNRHSSVRRGPRLSQKFVTGSKVPCDRLSA